MYLETLTERSLQNMAVTSTELADLCFFMSCLCCRHPRRAPWTGPHGAGVH